MKQFQFTDIYGRQWELPMSAVEKDYREHLAYFVGSQLETIEESELTTWFNEHFSWHEIKQDGKITKDLTSEQKNQVVRSVHHQFTLYRDSIWC